MACDKARLQGRHHHRAFNHSRGRFLVYSRNPYLVVLGIPAWCLHCPFCVSFIACSSFSNVLQHMTVHHGDCWGSYSACKNACSQANIVWPSSLESPGEQQAQQVLHSFDIFLAPSCFARLFVVSSLAALFAFSLAFVWSHCFKNNFEPYLRAYHNAAAAAATHVKRKPQRKRGKY